MIADIFYPISTLTITVLAYFIRKKKCLGALHSRLHQGTTLDPLGLTAPPRPPAAIVFGFVRNRCAHIFSVLSPDGGFLGVQVPAPAAYTRDFVSHWAQLQQISTHALPRWGNTGKNWVHQFLEKQKPNFPKACESKLGVWGNKNYYVNGSY